MSKQVSKVAIVTGAAQGIGREIALLLAAKGFNITVADINYDGAKKVAAEIKELGCDTIAIDADMGIPSMIENMITRTTGRWGRVDLAVNNAAVVKKQPFLETTIENWERVIDVSLNGYFYCTRLAANEMKKADGGKIINIASMVGFIPHGGLTAYSCAKAGVIAMTKLASNELAKHNIAVNAIAPGPTNTPLMKNVIGGVEDGGKKIPAAIIQSAGSIAKAVNYLVNDTENIINGNVINIGGGVLG